LGKHSIPCALAGRRVFDGEQDGSAPLAAEADALAEAAEREQDGGGKSDGVVGGQQADADGGDAHGEQGDDQGGLAADAVAEMAEEGRTDGASKERDAKSGQGVEARRSGISRREEEAGKDENRRGGEDVEIEELDGGADEAGDEHLGRGIDLRGSRGVGSAHGVGTDDHTEGWEVQRGKEAGNEGQGTGSGIFGWSVTNSVGIPLLDEVASAERMEDCLPTGGGGMCACARDCADGARFSKGYRQRWT